MTGSKTLAVATLDANSVMVAANSPKRIVVGKISSEMPSRYSLTLLFNPDFSVPSERAKPPPSRKITPHDILVWTVFQFNNLIGSFGFSGL